MDAGTWIAVYAAVVASGNVAWQVYVWRRARRAEVTVEVRHENQPEHPFVWVAGVDEPEPKLEYELTVVATNRGERTQFIERFGIRRADDPQAFDFEEPDDRALPPDESRRWSTRVEHLPFGLGEGFVAFVALGSGEVVESDPQRLDPLLLEATG